MSVGKPELKISLGVPSLGFKIILKRNIGFESVEWIGLDQDTVHGYALVNMVMNFLSP
jgi:hypothetical protein